MNYVSYVETILDDQLKVNNSPMVRSWSLAKRRSIRERYLADYLRFTDDKRRHSVGSAQDAFLPYDRLPAESGELRPLLHLTDAGSLFRPLEWDSANDPRLRYLKRVLIYAHRIVVPDPLFTLNRLLLTDTGPLDGRVMYGRFLDWLYIIKPLVEDGIVLFQPEYELLPQGGFDRDVFADPKFLAWWSAQEDRVAQVARAPVYLKQALDSDSGVRPGTVEEAISAVSAKHEDVIVYLLCCVRYGGTPFVTSAWWEIVLRELLGFGESLGGVYMVTHEDAKANQDVLGLARLVSMELPTLDRLSLEDIVRVRQQADGFEAFRANLREGVLRIERFDALHPDLQLESIRDSLARGRGASEAAIRQSSLLTSARGSTKQFGIGAVAGAVAGDPTGGLATGLASAALEVLFDFVAAGRERASDRALARHYSLWES